MPRKVHCVVKYPQNLKNAGGFVYDPEHDKVAPPSAVAGNVKGEQSCRNLISLLDSNEVWPGPQLGDCELQGLRIGASLLFTEAVRRPPNGASDVIVGTVRNADLPSSAPAHFPRRDPVGANSSSTKP